MSKIAWVLSGEGAKGSHQAMVMHKLEVQGIYPDFIVGTSSGAINAVGYSLLGANKLRSFWWDIRSIKDVFSFNWRFLWQSGVFTTKPLKKKLDAMKDLKFSVPVYFPVTNPESGYTFFVEAGAGSPFSMHRKLVAAAVTIPGVIRVDNDYVDGGAMILCPLKKAIDLGADEIYIILGRDPITPKADFKPKPWFSFIAYGNRFLELLMFTVIKNDIANCVRINKAILKNPFHPESSSFQHWQDGYDNPLGEDTYTEDCQPRDCFIAGQSAAAAIKSIGFGGKKEIKLHILYPKTPLYDSLDFKRCREMLTMADNIAEIHDVDLRSDL